MSKRKESPNSRTSMSSTESKPPKSARPDLLLDAELEEIKKLEKPEEIEARALSLRDDLVKEWNKGKELRDIQYIETKIAVAKVRVFFVFTVAVSCCEIVTN